MVLSFDLYLRCGGYWSSKDQYHGGGNHEGGRRSADGFTLQSVLTLVEYIGYEDNMNRVSWFPPETPQKKEDITDDVITSKVVHYSIGSGAMMLFIVREDDPYMGRHRDMRGSLNDAEDEDDFGSESSNEDNRVNDSSNSDSETEERGGRIEQDDPFGVSDSEGGDSIVDDNPIIFMLGQQFSYIAAFKTAITKYAVRKRRDIKFDKSDGKRVVAICSEKKCPWRISGSINSSSTRVVVRAYQEEHNCTWQGKVSLLTNSRIADIYIEEFRINPNISATQLQQKLQRRNINVSETICERTRLKCLQQFDDEQAQSFARLFDYVEELKSTNPGSTVECEVRQTRFYRFYVCFQALKDGWKGACRKIIHIDGTFLKWRMNGMLLVACGRDPNEQTFPIAWAIVEVENKDNWLWFFEHLVEDLGLGLGNGLTLASDQQKGLILAVQDVLPYAEHRMCARHVYSNWKKKYSGAVFEDLFWGAADAYYIVRFEKKMEELKKISVSAYDDLKISLSCLWSRAFFTEYSSSDAVENNLGESFNAAIRIARTKPVVEMLEDIRRKVMVSNHKKRVEADKCRANYTYKSVAKLEEQIELAKNCSPLSCGLGDYEVGYFNDRFVVKMRGDISCTCRMYKISGIPCCHIVSALRLEKNADQDPKTLISDWFTIEKLKTCYAYPLKPVNGMNMWKVTTNVRVNPPPFKKPPGRPPGKKRKRDKGEPREPPKISKRGTKIHCGNCGQEGHSKLHCKNQPVAKPPKNRPGRPRKEVTPPTSAALFIHAPEATPGSRKKWFASALQPEHDVPSLSSALPKRGPGRPRKKLSEGVSSSQP